MIADLLRLTALTLIGGFGITFFAAGVLSHQRVDEARIPFKNALAVIAAWVALGLVIPFFAEGGMSDKISLLLSGRSFLLLAPGAVLAFPVAEMLSRWGRRH